MNLRNDMDALFHPRNIALVGASDRRDHWSKRVWDNLARFGFSGRVFPVNPNRDSLWDEKCFADLAALPEPPDHLAIFTPAEISLEMLRAGGAAGARSATLYAAGFGEGGDESGRQLAGRLRAVLAQTGITAVGPACMGIAAGAFATIPDETLQPLAPGPVALVAQSGAICSSINRAVNELGLKLSHIASCGSQIGCTLSDFVDYYATVPAVKVILCYIEAVPDAEKFLAAARKARQGGKTVIAVKVGGSDQARASALAHTGALAGRTEIFDAYAASAGIVRLATLEDAIEAVEFLARRPLPRGRRIAAMTISGALKSLMTEAADSTGAELAQFSDATSAALAQVLEQRDIGNPLDTKRTRPTGEFAATLRIMLAAPEIDTVLVVDELPLEQSTARKVGNLRALEGLGHEADRAGKTLAMMTPLLLGMSEENRVLRAEFPGVPILRTSERTLRVLKALGDAGARPPQDGSFRGTPADTPTTRAWRARAAALTAPTALNEVESKALLAAYGIGLPREQLVPDAAEAEAAAAAIGYPVVLKAVSAGIAHKSDAGLVQLGLADAAAVRAAVGALQRRAGQAGVILDGFLVAEMIRGGTETVLGMGHDVEMGPFIMFGLGGVWVELLKDVSFAAANLGPAQADAMIRATRAGRLIAGYRGGRPADRDALIAALLNLGRLAVDLGDVIAAIDINPLIVRDEGHGAVALDGLVVLRPPPARI